VLARFAAARREAMGDSTLADLVDPRGALVTAPIVAAAEPHAAGERSEAHSVH
jgi:hypothetical protein